MSRPIRLAILGATGSIGTSTLDVVARHPDRFSVDVLAAHRNVEALAKLCRKFRPRVAIIADASRQDALHAQLKALNVQCEVHAGGDAVAAAAAATSNDTVVAAIVGAAGLESTLAAARAGKRLLLANKESVVMAGPLLMQALHAGGGELIPIDSEHNAIFQCLPGGRPPLDKAGVRRIVLTASGGPFRGRSRESLRTVTPDQACAHPNWDMGRKISVDSASMMNKGLEVIEAHHLFGAAPEYIDVLVHPQSMVHSMVEYLDGSVLAQLGHPDMRTALAHALAWPDRIEAGVPSLDLAQVASLHFEAPDTDTFRCLPLAFEALREGGDAPAILNAANEVAVAAFLDGALPFLRIPEVIETVLTELPAQPVVDIATLVHRDGVARQFAQRAIARHC